MTVTTWATPQPFFEMLHREFKFTLDVCALPGTAKCSRFYTPETDGLKQSWAGEVFFMNSPYGRGQDVYSWVRKAFEEATAGAIGVCLLPVSADTRWFHDFCMKAHEIRFVKDRLWFTLDGAAARANHASMVVVFKGKATGTAPLLSTVPNCKPERPAKRKNMDCAEQQMKLAL